MAKSILIMVRNATLATFNCVNCNTRFSFLLSVCQLVRTNLELLFSVFCVDNCSSGTQRCRHLSHPLFLSLSLSLSLTFKSHLLVLNPVQLTMGHTFRRNNSKRAMKRKDSDRIENQDCVDSTQPTTPMINRTNGNHQIIVNLS